MTWVYLVIFDKLHNREQEKGKQQEDRFLSRRLCCCLHTCWQSRRRVVLLSSHWTFWIDVAGRVNSRAFEADALECRRHSVPPRPLRMSNYQRSRLFKHLDFNKERVRARFMVTVWVI
ncbi:hypothetical protein CDAR_112631 [Caerostris darwini]|uniref:Uncharacterized protein n=1 Tax=Caerostris darwini TaxID=1538125 RepID=A0AAV4PZV5_9ARAC|nr:hypothetical protein CDAR_112631 [Caerostris darwini]